jgi:AraC family transcriptional regulator
MSHAITTWDLRLSRAPELSNLAATSTAAMGSDRSEGSVPASYVIHFYKCEATLVLGDQELEITPGSVSLVPPGDATGVLAVQDLGPEFMGLCERFEHALLVAEARPAQAEARLWDILWELAERTARTEQRQNRRHVALDRACRVIQSRLSEPLSLSDLATPAGVSPAHLTRLFRAELGLTATDYLRRCRLERALHLLTRSDVPIKEVACEVGIPDLHAFNKAIRRGYGISPRELRARGGAPGPLNLRSEPTRASEPLLAADVALDSDLATPIAASRSA